MTATGSAYALSASVYERERARGETPAVAMAYACKALRDNLPGNARRFVPGEAIVTAEHIAEAHGTTLAVLRSAQRHKSICVIRDEVAWRLREQGHSYPDIARVLKRHHTSVIVAVSRYEGRQEPNATEARAA
jgi:chromosomal replication initiation ATPase DnaA